MRWIMAMALLVVSVRVSAEAGMIDFHVEPGPVLGKGHWYALRTMKGVEFWEDPPTYSDILYDEVTKQYSINGEPPIALALVIHPDFEDGDEPWRRGLDWIRQAEQIFRNSGVPLRFIVNHIEVRNDLPDTKESAFHHVYAGDYAKYGVDMLVILMPHYFGDALCGIASIGSSTYYGGVVKSASGCGPKILAHELGHNFGLYHDGREESTLSKERPGGYCMVGEEGTAETCLKGTIMSYAQERVPFFANSIFQYNGIPLGTTDRPDSVEHLNKVKAGRALAWELDQQREVTEEVTFEVILD